VSEREIVISITVHIERERERADVLSQGRLS